MKLPREYRLSQIKDALEIIDNSLENIKFGKLSFFNVLGSQLRGLVVKGNNRQFNPLFLYLALETGYPIEFYTSDIENFPEELPVPDFNTTATFFSIDMPTGIKIRKFHLNDWLDKKVLRSLGKVYTGNDFIRMYSEKHGGAHYDPQLTQKELFLKFIQIGSNVGLLTSDDKIIYEFSMILKIHMNRFIKTT